MDRKALILAAFAAANGDVHTPVQVQKLLFLIDKNLSGLIGGPFFDFKPYHYGPFDQKVYDVLEDLVREGLVEVVPEQTWKNHRLNLKGQACGDQLLSELPEEAKDYIRRVSEFVRSLTFPQLVTAIYTAYPDMRANSVFQE